MRPSNVRHITIPRWSRMRRTPSACFRAPATFNPSLMLLRQRYASPSRESGLIRLTMAVAMLGPLAVSNHLLPNTTKQQRGSYVPKAKLHSRPACKASIKHELLEFQPQ